MGESMCKQRLSQSPKEVCIHLSHRPKAQDADIYGGTSTNLQHTTQLYFIRGDITIYLKRQAGKRAVLSRQG